MKIKIFDESHEKDLEEAINKFLQEKEWKYCSYDDRILR